MTGGLNLRGQLTSIGALKAKLRAAFLGGCQKLIAPAADVEELKASGQIPLELRGYAETALIPASSMLDVIHHTIEGEALV